MTAKLFRPGPNIAMNVPPAQFEQTVKFYTEILGFETIPTETANSIGIVFGAINLWIDSNKKVAKTEIFFEISVNNLEQAKTKLNLNGIQAYDNPFETLSESYRGFWIKNPADMIHLVDLVEASSAE